MAVAVGDMATPDQSDFAGKYNATRSRQGRVSRNFPAPALDQAFVWQDHGKRAARS